MQTPARQLKPLPGEEAWIPEVKPGELRWPKREIFGGLAKWTRYTGAHRLCDTCVEVCQDYGVAAAPRPMPATQKRVGPMGPRNATLHCAAHAVAYQAKDEEIARRVATKTAHAAHVQRAQRSR